MLRHTVEGLLARVPNEVDRREIAIAICLYFDAHLSLSGNGWFDDDPEWNEIERECAKRNSGETTTSTTSEQKVSVDIGNAPVKGAASAPVKIIAFSEFQGRFCSRAAQTMKQIKETYGAKVAVAFKQFPLPFRDKADLAAQASLAANEQGKFWEMHDKLFANQSALDRTSLEGYAKDLGLDVQQFSAALDSGKFRDQISKDKEQGSKAGVTATPSFFINGKLVVGAQPFEEFKRTIDEALSAR